MFATGTASAQRADTTAASEADDAFGLSVAGETIGLYSDKYVRGFSPVNAGNLRLDGLYIDRQGEFTDRLFADVAVRVGATALETPLPARDVLLVDHPHKHHGAACSAMITALTE